MYRNFRLRSLVIMNSLFFQILTIYNALESIDTNRVTEYIKSLQQPDGSFFGDKWGEVDTRFSFCAIMSLSLLVSCFIVIVKKYSTI